MMRQSVRRLVVQPLLTAGSYTVGSLVFCSVLASGQSLPADTGMVMQLLHATGTVIVPTLICANFGGFSGALHGVKDLLFVDQWILKALPKSINNKEMMRLSDAENALPSFRAAMARFPEGILPKLLDFRITRYLVRRSMGPVILGLPDVLESEIARARKEGRDGVNFSGIISSSVVLAQAESAVSAVLRFFAKRCLVFCFISISSTFLATEFFIDRKKKD
jgi:hypothetical protein